MSKVQPGRSYATFAELYRRVFQGAEDHAILEAFRRGIKAEVGGVAPTLVLSIPGERPDRAACDIDVHAVYGPQEFHVICPSSTLEAAAASWEEFARSLPLAPDAPSSLTRDFAEWFVVTAITDNRQAEVGALIANALAWLLRGSSAGADLGDTCTRAVYEITDAVSGWDFHASGVVYAGILGYLAHRSPKHQDGGLSLLISDTLMVGALHRFPKLWSNGLTREETVFDVRTVLDVDEIGDSRAALLEQGQIAGAAVAAWLKNEAGLEERTLAERIPALPRREDTYPVRVARTFCTGR